MVSRINSTSFTVNGLLVAFRHMRSCQPQQRDTRSLEGGCPCLPTCLHLCFWHVQFLGFASGANLDVQLYSLFLQLIQHFGNFLHVSDCCFFLHLLDDCKLLFFAFFHLFLSFSHLFCLLDSLLNECFLKKGFLVQAFTFSTVVYRM